MIRLDKALVAIGIGSRNDIKKMVKARRIEVNGELATKSDLKIEEDSEILIDGEPFYYEKYVYLMMNKPKGVISATEGLDPTVIDLIDMPAKGLFPCGRLDKDTTGLLLITNDGPLAHQLLSPKHHVEKEYEVTLLNPVSEQDILRISKGIQDGEDTFMPATYIPLGEKKGRIILHEGKFHEIKRIFSVLDNEVTDLKRVRMKNLVLDESLEPGEYRILTDEELTELRG